MRELPHPTGREVFIQHDKDFASTVYYKGEQCTFPVFFLKEADGQFSRIFEPGHKDWYMIVSLEKANKITIGRHQITAQLLMEYRWAIREGYNHQLDTKLRNAYDHPGNRNTIEGVQGYITGIRKKSAAEMDDLQ